jgi:beta-phosphoglucomutase
MASAVIFDMDGVLVDSEGAHLKSWVELARRDGLDATPEQFSALFGRRSQDIARAVWGAATSDERILELDAEKERIYREIVTGGIPLMPGCAAALQRLRDAGYTLAVGTSGPPENLQLVLDEGGIGPFFAAIVHGFDIKRGKPAPDCFLLAAERISTPPAQCVVIEDAPFGIQAGNAAGMPVIGFTGTHPIDALRAAGAAVIIDHLDELTADLIASVSREPTAKEP